MAYNKKDLEDKALKAIKKHNLVFISDIMLYLPCSDATFYNHNLEKLESIKKALEFNKINDKVKLRKKFKTSENPTLQMFYYKLIANNNELSKVGNKHDHTSKGDKINFIVPSGEVGNDIGNDTIE